MKKPESVLERLNPRLQDFDLLLAERRDRKDQDAVDGDVNVPVDQINRAISLDPSPAKLHCLFDAVMIIDLEVSGLSAAET